jgi:hypothetical protein
MGISKRWRSRGAALVDEIAEKWAQHKGPNMSLWDQRRKSGRACVRVSRGGGRGPRAAARDKAESRCSNADAAERKK